MPPPLFLGAGREFSRRAKIHDLLSVSLQCDRSGVIHAAEALKTRLHGGTASFDVGRRQRLPQRLEVGQQIGPLLRREIAEQLLGHQ